MEAKDPAIATLHPEVFAGGFSHRNSRFHFYSRVQALLSPEMTVVDFGAGRGKWAENERGFLRELARLKGKAAKVIGLDPDPVVLENPDLDEAHVLELGKPFPLPDASVDLIVSWAVLEHVEDAGFTAREIERVLKPGGWLCAWTPNKFGYVGIAANLVPNSLHQSLLKVFSPGRKAEDTFPTRYRMNTRRALERLFPPARFRHASFYHQGPPAYHAHRVWLARIWGLYNWLCPPFALPHLQVFIQKR